MNRPLKNSPASRSGIGMLALMAVAWLAGCATALPTVERPASTVRVGDAGAPLVQVAAEAQIPPGLTGVRPLPQAAFALDARLAMIARAQSSIDVQTYVLADDATGRLVLRALRDAAARGVRVRLLLDDLHTTGADELLLGFAAQPNVELRLFNPFGAGRDSGFARLAALLSDFRRLNHRMHNKLFIADGAVAVVGGRNLADEYFLRSVQSNFIDFDLLLTGAVLPQLNTLFDSYWNSAQAYPVQAVAASGLTTAALRTAFDVATAGLPLASLQAAPAADLYGQPPFSVELAQHRFGFLAAPARAHADDPRKAEAGNTAAAHGDTVTRRFIDLLGEAQSEVLLFSPYFVPGQSGLAHIRAARQRGIEVRVITNSLAASDEPVVNIGYERYRRQLLEMGVALYEISPARLKRDRSLRESLGSSSGRLHAKLGFIDRKTVLVGSMNLDPRSSWTNTEIGVAVRSPELARKILEAYKVDNFVGIYRVKLRPDGAGLHWSALGDSADAVAEEELDDEPDSTLWQRLQVFLLSLVVPEDLL